MDTAHLYESCKERADNRILSASYRLCVLASGSLITDTLNRLTLISICCLHFGQNSGKFSSNVSSRNLMRVLFLQIGHISQSMTCAILYSAIRKMFSGDHP